MLAQAVAPGWAVKVGVGIVLTNVAVDEVAVAAAQPFEVYLMVTVLLPVVNHFKVTVLLVVPTPPDVIE